MEKRKNEFARCGFVEFICKWIYGVLQSAPLPLSHGSPQISKLRTWAKSKSEMKRECQRVSAIHGHSTINVVLFFFLSIHTMQKYEHAGYGYVIMQLQCERAIVVNDWKFSERTISFCAMHFVPFLFTIISVNKENRLFNHTSACKNFVFFGGPTDGERKSNMNVIWFELLFIHTFRMENGNEKLLSCRVYRRWRRWVGSHEHWALQRYCIIYL